MGYVGTGVAFVEPEGGQIMLSIGCSRARSGVDAVATFIKVVGLSPDAFQRRLHANYRGTGSGPFTVHRDRAFVPLLRFNDLRFP